MKSSNDCINLLNAVHGLTIYNVSRELYLEKIMHGIDTSFCANGIASAQINPLVQYVWERKHMKKIFKAVVTLVLCVHVSCSLDAMMKPFPQPLGPYTLGTTQAVVSDKMRNDEYAHHPQQRTLLIRLWYPTFAKSSSLYPYLGSAMPAFQQLVGHFYSIPLWLSRLLLEGRMTHAYSNSACAPSAKGWPIVLFSHGLLGMPSETYVSIIEAIASAGYVVVAIEHPYFNVLTQYPDGTIVDSHTLSDQFAKMAPEQQRNFQTAAVKTYQADMACVLNYLTTLNNDLVSEWHHALDLQNVVVMGHSAGGTAAIEFCRSHPECKGAIDLDGWYDHCIGNEPIAQPVLLIFGSKIDDLEEPTAAYLGRKKLTRQEYYDAQKAIANHKRRICQPHTCRLLELNHVAHDDFSDLILRRWPLREWYAPDPYATLNIINKGIIQFLQQCFSIDYTQRA